ncbi:MAG TPA: SLC13 family permease, partial [bacterium]|nr:SLC13 family permease [bacterium]
MHGLPSRVVRFIVVAMTFEAWITLSVLTAVLIILTGSRRAPDAVLLGGLGILLISGVLEPRDALRGFSNEGVITIAVLYCVASGLRETGAMDWVTRLLLGRPRSIASAQARIMVPTAAMSAFMNNTPLVAIVLPVVNDWARRHRFSPSKILIPLSYASILGGACTLIGTSTNLVVNGWLLDEGYDGLGMFEITPLGLPCLVLGILIVLLGSRWLLPDRKPPISQEHDPRSYTLEMTVAPDGPLVDKTIEGAGLRHLPGVYLMEVERDGETIPAVGPTERLKASDRLVFVGIVESVVDLQKIPGLVPAADQVFKLDAPRGKRLLVEAVVSDSCPVVGMNIREGRFRTRYNAVVVAVARSGRRIHKKIGDIVLQPGDTLMLEALPSFVAQQRNRRDFYLVSTVDGSTPPDYERAPIALGILAIMVIVVAFGLLSMLKAALLAAGLMLLTRCVTASAMRRALDWQVLLVIAASLGIGRALQISGLA